MLRAPGLGLISWGALIQKPSTQLAKAFNQHGQAKKEVHPICKSSLVSFAFRA